MDRTEVDRQLCGSPVNDRARWRSRGVLGGEERRYETPEHDDGEHEGPHDSI